MTSASNRFTVNLIFALLLTFHVSSAQDVNNVKKIIGTLASPGMYGRGYVNNGSPVAANFLASEMERIGLKSFPGGFKQDFNVDVRTYPTKVVMSVNGKNLKPGYEFTVFTGSPSIKGAFKLIKIDSSSFRRNGSLKKMKKDLTSTFICYDPSLMKGKFKKMADSLLKNNFTNCAGFIHLSTKQSITWSVMSRGDILRYPVFTVLTSALPPLSNEVTVEVELKQLNNYKISNVIGYIPGTIVPDSFIVVTAHYDHIGMMGSEVYFPGANDNASGTAMILDLAKHYMADTNKLACNIVFMAFAGEEIGLKGSEYYVEHPLFPLKNIKFLLNLDMVGTGSEGITMVNADQFPAYYNLMVKINADNEYLMKVAKRGESCNSDHCPFYKKGVPAVFIYSNGKEYLEYHNPNDKAENLPLTEYSDIFRLIRDYINSL
ncbi:MAG: M28 family metallopeptidase [Chloroflexota bacterium]